jgi:hypothetical protein
MPVRLEARTRSLEALGDAGAVLTGFAAGMEAAGPEPLRGGDGDTGTSTDVPDDDISVEDVPDLSMRVIAAAAGEGGHGKSFRRSGARANHQDVGDRNCAGLQHVVGCSQGTCLMILIAMHLMDRFGKIESEFCKMLPQMLPRSFFPESISPQAIEVK